MIANPSDATILDLLASVRTIAVVGASANPARPSHDVTAWLAGRGYEVVAVNPGHAGGTIAGVPCFASLADVPHPIDMVDVFRRSDAVPGIVDEVLAMAPQPMALWLQLGVVHEDAATRARTAGIIVVQDRCPKIELMRR